MMAEVWSDASSNLVMFETEDRIVFAAASAELGLSVEGFALSA